MTARGTIVTAAAVTGAVAYLNAAARNEIGDVGPRPMFSALFMAGALSLIAEASPDAAQLAAALAVLIAVASAITLDRRITTGVANAVRGGAPAAPIASRSSGPNLGSGTASPSIPNELSSLPLAPTVPPAGAGGALIRVGRPY